MNGERREIQHKPPSRRRKQKTFMNSNNLILLLLLALPNNANEFFIDNRAKVLNAISNNDVIVTGKLSKLEVIGKQKEPTIESLIDNLPPSNSKKDSTSVNIYKYSYNIIAVNFGSFPRSDIDLIEGKGLNMWGKSYDTLYMIFKKGNLLVPFHLFSSVEFRSVTTVPFQRSIEIGRLTINDKIVNYRSKEEELLGEYYKRQISEPKAIKQYISDRFPEIERIYRSTILNKPTKSDTMVFTIEVDKNGKVINSNINQSTITDTVFVKKAFAIINTWKFANINWDSGTTLIKYPFVFNNSSNESNRAINARKNRSP